jgi:cytoplasmic iron level regulating protein YaaA (DUF328/UPF0246 family)
MVILLSPAKTMQLKNPNKTFSCLYQKESLNLRKTFKHMPIKNIMAFFHVSKEVAKQTSLYYNAEDTYQVYDMFDGIGYRTLKSLSNNIPRHIYALSGLYGILHLSDQVYPYRLDLKHPIKGSLISYWKEKLYERLKDEPLIISCASSEYEQILDPRLNIIYVHIFHGDKKASSVDAKKVRASLAYHIDTYGLDTLASFEYDGYKFIEFIKSDIIIKKN